jgi:limonene-1,2-epoxide hydrolase
VKGLPAILEKGHQFGAMVEEVHANHVSDAVVAGSWFSVSMLLDVTMKGRGRVHMKEICVYRVHDGKITHEKFFFDVT